MNNLSENLPSVSLTELKSDESGVAMGEERLFIHVNYRGPRWWRFRLIDLSGGYTPKTAWISVKEPGDLRVAHKAKPLRDLLEREYKDEWRQVLELAIGTVQDNEEKWAPIEDEETKDNPKFSDDVLKEAGKVLEFGDPFHFVCEQAAKLHAGDPELIQVEYISALSGPISGLPINLWTIGSSGKGKTHSKYTIVTLLPRDLYLVFTSASPLSLFYYIKHYGADALDGKLLFIDEVEASKFAMPMLRSLTSQTPILPRHLSVHEAEILDLEILGKRAVWFTSVKTFGSSQIKNRFIHVNPDETENQDDRVFTLQDSLYRQNKKQQDDFTITRALSYQIVQDTKDLGVVIPYAIEWPFKERRWLYPIFLSFIKTICKVRYKQREKDEHDNLIATPEDFVLAKGLWKSFEDTIAKRVTGSAQTILEELGNRKSLAKTHAELSEIIPLGTRQITRLCEELLEEGLVNRQKRGSEKGRPAWEYWKVAQPEVMDISIKYDETFRHLDTPSDTNIFRQNNVEKPESPKAVYKTVSEKLNQAVENHVKTERNILSQGNVEKSKTIIDSSFLTCSFCKQPIHTKKEDYTFHEGQPIHTDCLTQLKKQGDV